MDRLRETERDRRDREGRRETEPNRAIQSETESTRETSSETER